MSGFVTIIATFDEEDPKWEHCCYGVRVEEDEAIGPRLDYVWAENRLRIGHAIFSEEPIEDHKRSVVAIPNFAWMHTLRIHDKDRIDFIGVEREHARYIVRLDGMVLSRTQTPRELGWIGRHRVDVYLSRI